MSDPGDELVDVVDADDRVVGTVTRREIRERRLLHRCTYVFVLDPDGRLFVHRRTDTKDAYPGFFDVVAGGVNAVGETFDACAAREVREELGVTATPTFRFVHRYEGPDGRALGGVYDVVWGGPIRPQESEVAWGAFMTLEEVDALIAREPVCTDSLEVYARWRVDFARGRVRTR